MFRHNFLLIYRNFKRFKSTFFINLIGLSTGLACALLIYLWVNDELNVDKFHEKDSQLFQVMTNHHNNDGIITWKKGPGLLGEALEEEMPEVENAVSSSGIQDDFTLSVDDTHVSVSGQFVEKDFFDIFSYDLLQGDKNQVLSDKNAIVISEEMAKNLFNNVDNVIGKTLEWNTSQDKKTVFISGVFKDIPPNSSDQFDFVLSYEVFKDILGEYLNWGNHPANITLVLKEGTNVNHLNNKIANFLKTKDEESNVTLFVKPFSENYLYSKYEDGVQAGGRIEYVKLFSIIATFILVIACINFMNLSTAKASRRIKEVGIKKAIGAGRKTLIFQYIGESLLMAFISLIIAILIVALLLPQFNEIIGKRLIVHFDNNLILSLLATTLFTGLIAGSYPALYLSGFNPVTVLKGKLNTSVGELWARKGLVVFQFTLSIILIVAVLVVFNQIEYVQTKNLGYNNDNVIYFQSEGKVAENLETFLTKVKGVPGIIDASSMSGSFVGRTGVTFGSFYWEGRNPDEIIPFEHLGVNFDMIELLGIEVKEGRTFSRNFPADTSNIILNEAAIEVMGLKDPVGKIFNLWGNDMEIIGVVKNFHFKSLHENIKPFFFRLRPNESNKVMAKIEAGREREAIEHLHVFHKSFNPGYTFDYQFLDEEYQAQYVAEQRIATLSKYFAGLAILISCLGLFGLAAFTAERRLKEIGIRKILGSTEFEIVRLLSGDFTKMVLTAILIALPLSYFIVKNWLDNFAFKIDLEWWYFLGAGLAALLIAWLTVGMQALKAARINPVVGLKDE